MTAQAVDPDGWLSTGDVGTVDDRGLSESGLIAWARDRPANYEVPRHVVFVDDLPRNPSMKVVKPRLRSLWADRTG